MSLELAWGRLRRAWLRRWRPDYVTRMQQLRRGCCPNCPHEIVDYRDLKYYRNVCGYFFGEEDRYTRPGWVPLAPLGHAEIVVAGVLTAALVLFALIGGMSWHWPISFRLGLTLVALAAWAQTLYFFRDPERTIPPEPGLLVSPADGVVTYVGTVAEPDFPNGQAWRISIFLSVFDVHMNRSPCAGRVVARHYFPGQFGNALNNAVSDTNEQFWTDIIEAGTGQRIRVKQIAGAIARRIVCWLRADETVERGQRIGLIKFGSRTDLLVPADGTWEACVTPGQRVYGGSTVVMRRRHH